MGASLTVPDHAAASRVLARCDPTMRELVRAFGPCELRRPRHSGFATLCRAIVFQQLAGAAASTIWRRVNERIDGTLTPRSLLEVSPRRLKSAGLSAAKLRALIDLAERSVGGSVRLRGLWRRSDADVVEHLTQVHGIGQWTAEMFLIFHLHRLDVWPVGDLGVRKGFAEAYGMKEMPTPKALDELGDPFRPYRSVAAWYMWRVLDGPY